MADLTTVFAGGIRCPNPFWLASGPPANCGEQVMRAFDAGWGGAVWKTLGEPIVNVSSRAALLGAPGEYVDYASGTREDRPQYQALFSAARRRQLDVVLVWRYDRFARSTPALVNALKEFQSLGVDFISYQEHIDTTTPQGELVFTVMASLAQFESALMAFSVETRNFGR